MSNDDELNKLREQRMQELREQQLREQQSAQNQQRLAQQQATLEQQKKLILQKILTSEARSRLANIQLARPQYADQLVMQLIQAFQSGALRGRIPLTDDQFKNLLKDLHNRTQTREPQIKFR